MTTRKQEIKERLSREFEICDRHILRISEALNGLNVELPMTRECYDTMTSEQIRCVDQFIFRFSKLQDTVGAKIFRYVLELLDEDVNSLPMRDILNLLERYNIIYSVDEWLYMRELRNDITHDYSLSDDDIFLILNELIQKVDVLISIYDNLKELDF